MKNARKKSVAVLAGLAITGLIGAAAASLGGINSDSLGADTGVVSSCDSDGVDVAYSYAFSAGLGEYVVTGVTVSAIDEACDGQTLAVTLSDGDDVVLGSGSAPVDDSGAVTVSIPAASAEAVENIAIVISS
jgi:hypothetical protein